MKPDSIRTKIAKWRQSVSLPSSAHWDDSKWQAARELETLLSAWEEYNRDLDQYEGAGIINEIFGEKL